MRTLRTMGGITVLTLVLLVRPAAAGVWSAVDFSTNPYNIGQTVIVWSMGEYWFPGPGCDPEYCEGFFEDGWHQVGLQADGLDGYYGYTEGYTCEYVDPWSGEGGAWTHTADDSAPGEIMEAIHYTGWMYVQTGQGSGGATSNATLYPAVPCGGSEVGYIILEYANRRRWGYTGAIPDCSDFTNSLPGFPSGTWNDGGYGYVILRSSVTGGAACLAGYVGDPGVTSGYRNPARNAQISVANSRHVYGDAVDMHASNEATVSYYRGVSKDLCSNPCVEPWGLVYQNPHFHMDYRGSCPSGW